RADGAECRRKEREYNRRAALLAERDRLAILVHQREVRSLRSDVWRHTPPAGLGRSSAPTFFYAVRIGFSVGLGTEASLRCLSLRGRNAAAPRTASKASNRILGAALGFRRRPRSTL